MIKTRFSPSPTGRVHLGNVRTALFSALFAVHSQGCFLLRIEDTDATRSEHQYIGMLQDDLRWLEIQWQEGPEAGGSHGPYFQSQRHAIYDGYYQQLEDQKLAYPCFCTEQELALNRKLQVSRGQPPRYPGTCRSLTPDMIKQRQEKGLKPALRFRVPINTFVEFTDLIKGPQKFNSDDIGDFIIRRADGSSSFLFCNAIDDSLMEVTHVLRGEDHLANTPRQLMILQILKMRTPHYGHLSLIVGSDGAPLSKRHGSSSLHDLRVQGYLPLAVLNYLARLSHVYEENRLLSFKELANHFNIEKISRAPARFDVNQLLYWQKEAITALDKASAWKWIGEETKNKIPENARDLFMEIVQKNMLFPQEALKWETILFSDELTFTAEQESVLRNAGSLFFTEINKAIDTHQTDLKQVLDEIKIKLNVSGKSLFMPVRIALTGEEHGPELIHIANLLGADKMKKRFSHAFELTRK